MNAMPNTPSRSPEMTFAISAALKNSPPTFSMKIRITMGNNVMAGTSVGFNAGTGWDDASGWGTPNVTNLVPDLVACATTATCP